MKGRSSYEGRPFFLAYTARVPAVIANPILNSPFKEPSRHFRFNDEGITDQIADGRRESGYFLPIASPRKKGGQLKFETEWTQDRFLSSPRINRIRERVKAWRAGGYVGVTRTTERLLHYWNDPDRERKLFFCQREALETAIYLTEVASHFGDAWIENELRKENADFNDGLPRLALKMATGSGKTVVMAMLIAWQALNKLEDKHDRRFSDAFLIVAPGITIRDRLRVLLPTDPQNYYRERDIVPGDMLERLGQARIVITNYHAFIPRERGDASKLTKSILTKGESGAFTESPDQVVPDLSMGDELLKKTGAGNLFMVFGEPDVRIEGPDQGGDITVYLNGVDVYDPTTGAIRSNSTDDIACWFIDTNYDGESFFVRHAYFTGADEPYEKLKRALRAEIDEAAWSTLYSTVSRPFAQPETGKIAVKVINHYGDEVLKVFEV